MHGRDVPSAGRKEQDISDMVEVKVEIPYEEIKRRLGTLQHRSGHVIARAANRSITTGKKVIKQETARIYNVRQKDVEKILKTERATAEHPHVHMVFRDTHQNLAVFGKETSLTPRTPVRSSDPFNPDPEYVKARVMNGYSAVPLRERPRPFVQFVGGDRRAILLQRVDNSSRAPLRGVSGPALPQILKNEAVVKRFQNETSKMFTKRLNHEIDQVVKGRVK